MSRPSDWTDEQVFKLRELYPNILLDVEYIAEQIDKTVNAVRIKASRLGIQRNYLTPLHISCPHCGQAIDLTSISAGNILDLQEPQHIE